MRKPYFLYKGNELVDVCLSKKEIGNISYDFITRDVAKIPALIKWDKHQETPAKKRHIDNIRFCAFCEADVIEFHLKIDGLRDKIKAKDIERKIKWQKQKQEREQREKERKEEQIQKEIKRRNLIQELRRTYREKIKNMLVPLTPDYSNYKYMQFGYLGYFENQKHLTFCYYYGNSDFYTIVLDENNKPAAKVVKGFIPKYEIELFKVRDFINNITYATLPDDQPGIFLSEQSDDDDPSNISIYMMETDADKDMDKTKILQIPRPLKNGWYLLSGRGEVLPALYNEMTGTFYAKFNDIPYYSTTPIYYFG